MTRRAPSADDVFQLDSRGKRVEIVDGVLVEMPRNGWDHGCVITSAATRLLEAAEQSGAGHVVLDVLFSLDSAERLALAPAVAYVRNARLPPPGRRDGAFDGRPDIASERPSRTTGSR